MNLTSNADNPIVLANSNEAFHINFTADGQDVFDEPFAPAFTYPIFGEDETIIGYSNPQIDLKFRSSDLRPSVTFRYDEKWKAIGETQPMEVEKLLGEFLPEHAFGSHEANGHGQIEGDWKPPGTLVASYERNGKSFEMYCSTLADSKAREVLGNMRILVPLFIEGGTPCHYLDDPPWSLARWKLFLLYEVGDSNTYILAGFSTSYRLWVFPDRTIRTALGQIVPPRPSTPKTSDELEAQFHTDLKEEPGPRQATPPPTPPEFDTSKNQYAETGTYSPLDAPSRERISQFIILPPYQSAGHGSKLYTAMVKKFRSDSDVYEITVEDPNEDFDALRDYCDLAYLRTLPEFTSLTIKDTVPDNLLKDDEPVPTDYLVDEDLLEKLRWKSKIMPRQFARLTEMQLLSTIPAHHRLTTRLIRKEKSSNADDRRFWFWRMYVKHRIYIKNADQLIQLDESERGPKVAEAVDAQCDEYNERLDKFSGRRAQVEETNGVSKRKGKKRVVDDEDDEDDEDGGVAGTKRVKVT